MRPSQPSAHHRLAKHGTLQSDGPVAVQLAPRQPRRRESRLLWTPVADCAADARSRDLVREPTEQSHPHQVQPTPTPIGRIRRPRGSSFPSSTADSSESSRHHGRRRHDRAGPHGLRHRRKERTGRPHAASISPGHKRMRRRMLSSSTDQSLSRDVRKPRWADILGGQPSSCWPRRERSPRALAQLWPKRPRKRSPQALVIVTRTVGKAPLFKAIRALRRQPSR